MPTLALRITRLPMTLLWTIYFCGCLIVLDASFTCKAGYRVVKKQRTQDCEPCNEGYHQPTENDSTQCQVCTKCTKGSKEVSPCSSINNTVCKCLRGFRSRELDSSTCRCDVGSVIKMDECLECEKGFFSSTVDSPCRAWTKCKENRVKVNGTKTSDVVCHEPLDPWTPASMTSVPKTETTWSRAPPTARPPVVTTGSPHLKTTSTHTAGNSDRNHVLLIIISVAAGVVVGLLVLIAVAIRCKANEGPRYKRPIKETQQAKLHVIDM